MEGKIIFHKRDKEEFRFLTISKDYHEKIEHIAEVCNMNTKDVVDILINFALRYTIIDEGEES